MFWRFVWHATHGATVQISKGTEKHNTPCGPLVVEYILYPTTTNETYPAPHPPLLVVLEYPSR